MALPKKTSRSINVDGQSYRWMIRDNGDHYLLAIQHASGRGQKLTLSLYAEGRRIDLPALEVTPGLVEKIIREGLKMGWQPERLGSPQSMRIRQGDALIDGLKQDAGGNITPC